MMQFHLLIHATSSYFMKKSNNLQAKPILKTKKLKFIHLHGLPFAKYFFCITNWTHDAHFFTSWNGPTTHIISTWWIELMDHILSKSRNGLMTHTFHALRIRFNGYVFSSIDQGSWLASFLSFPMEPASLITKVHIYTKRVLEEKRRTSS